MVEGLVTTNDRNTYIPVLATQIPTAENGLVRSNEDGTVDMTWQLQENVRWHDGEAFTSEDVCFTWRFVSSAGSQTYNRDQYLGIVECLMPDEHTVVLRWDGMYGYYAGLFEAILPEHVLGGMTTEEIVNFTPYNRGPALVGTGPFRFAEWKSGEYLRVVRNADYWRGSEFPAIDEIVWAFIPDSNTRLNALKSGRYDFARIEPTQVAEAESIAAYVVHKVSSNSVMHPEPEHRTRPDLVQRACGAACDVPRDRPAGNCPATDAGHGDACQYADQSIEPVPQPGCRTTGIRSAARPGTAGRTRLADWRRRHPRTRRAALFLHPAQPGGIGRQDCGGPGDPGAIQGGRH
jgi:hypothetical protein